MADIERVPRVLADARWIQKNEPNKVFRRAGCDQKNATGMEPPGRYYRHEATSTLTRKKKMRLMVSPKCRQAKCRHPSRLKC